MTHPSSVSSEPSLGLKPNRRYRHGYAIMRVDDYFGPETPTERRVTIKRIVFDHDEAEQEVARLNNLQDADGSRYFLQIARIEPTDEDRGKTQAIHANRISALVPEPTPDVISDERRAKLEAVIVRDAVQESLPEGWGFPAFRACEICVDHTETDYIKWHEFNFCIYKKNNNGFVEIVGTSERQPDRRKVVFCAFRVYPDLTEDSIYDMRPLAILRVMADRFGLTMISGSNRGKFFLTEEFPVPTIVVPGTQNGHVFVTNVPEGHAHRDALFFSRADSVIRIPLAFSIDTTEYLRWVESQ